MSDNRELTYTSRTVVLVGRTGNGKSATGNSILGRKAFKSRAGPGGLTTACQREITVLKDGQIINVIDTPGLFDFASGSELMKKCLWLARDGIHAILVVFSIRSRFSQEEEAAFRSLQNFFGSKIKDYMIVVFTGGDDLESDETLEDYLGRDCPQPLKDLVAACNNRCVLFDNKTKDETQKDKQRQELLSLVNTILLENGGCPFNSDEMVIRMQMEPIVEEVSARFKKESAEVNDARQKAEEKAQKAEEKAQSLSEQNKKLEEELSEERKKKNESSGGSSGGSGGGSSGGSGGGCTIQ